LVQARQVIASYSFSGNIWIVIQLVLDVETGRGAPENEISHIKSNDPDMRDHDPAQGSARRFFFPPDMLAIRLLNKTPHHSPAIKPRET
jgi:hypothetical protein